MAAPEVLFQLSGSIAAYKACHVVSRLVQAGCAVQTVATEAALQFVGPATLEGLTGRPVAVDTFARGAQMDHIHLVRRADLVVLCPATANTINRLAAGVADDLIGTMFLAYDFRVPYVVVPAMNAAMYEHPATAASLERLRGWGIRFVDPTAGSLACGEIGPGRLAEPDDIVVELLRLLPGAPPAAPTPRGRVLVTAGGTKVPIDGVRAITNASTGATGAAIAAHFARAGYDVTLVHAAGAEVPDSGITGITRIPFTTFDDLAGTLDDVLSSALFDAAIHLAAVSDYGVDHLTVDGADVSADPGRKLASGHAVQVHLAPTPKLLLRLKQLGGDRLVVVGFKLTNGASADERLAAVAAIAAGTDVVVHNDASERDGGQHPAVVYRTVDGRVERVAEVADDAALAAALEREVGVALTSR